MAKRVLALTVDGRLTYCTAPEEMRGKGRCNHIAHQEENQSPEDFIMSVEKRIVEEDGGLVDQTEYINSIVEKYSINSKNPDWESIIRGLENPFHIGSEKDGTYEEAKMIDFKQELIKRENGDVYHLVAKYEFRGEEYECDFGEVPVVNKNGTITINGVDWRCLPVVEQNKAGVISYDNNIVVKQKDGRNISIIMDRDPENPNVKIYGKEVPIEVVQNYLQTGDETGLTTGQVYALKDIDPVVYERFPNFKTNLADLKNLDPDDPGDLEWRRCIRYEDIVAEQYRLQMRRMGNTFRTNLIKQTEKGFTEDEAPLFYQVNLTNNIKKDLVGRSNVQFATDLNPIAALSQSEKISLTGPGGWNKDKAPYSLRMPHKSHENIIDSMDVSSGKNIGLTATLSNAVIGEDRLIHQKEEGSKSLSPSDFIPYRYHNDPNRAIMAVAHLKQACPIVGGEDPIVKTKAWEEISGAKIGTNLNIAYIPGIG